MPETKIIVEPEGWCQTTPSEAERHLKMIEEIFRQVTIRFELWFEGSLRVPVHVSHWSQWPKYGWPRTEENVPELSDTGFPFASSYMPIRDGNYQIRLGTSTDPELQWVRHPYIYQYARAMCGLYLNPDRRRFSHRFRWLVETVSEAVGLLALHSLDETAHAYDLIADQVAQYREQYVHPIPRLGAH